jgi:hypothetical protein
MAWVRVDGLEHIYTGLLLTDRWQKGSAHWQINRKGEVILNVKHSAGKDDRTRTPPVLGPDNLGQWTHLAAVYDHQAGRVTHYVNGRAVSSHEILYPTLLHIGPADVGNWGSRVHEYDKVPIRNLSGRMDEFLLFDRALGAREIRDLYRAGKPSS